MSADNWAICPKCKAAKIKDQEKALLKAGKSYGSVPPEKYLEMVSVANEPLKFDDTLREDYEIGIDDSGRFYVSYGGGCSVCNLSFNFKHEEFVIPPTEQP